MRSRARPIGRGKNDTNKANGNIIVQMPFSLFEIKSLVNSGDDDCK